MRRSVNNIHDHPPDGKWMKQGEAVKGEAVWKATTDFVNANPDHDIFNGCSPLDSWTGLNERRIVLFGKTAKGFSDVLGCRYANIVDGYDDTDEGRLKQKRARDNLKLRMKHCLKECKRRLSAVAYTRIVVVSGVEHTFDFDWLCDNIYNTVMQYYDDAHRDNEAFAGVTKLQALVNLLSLPIDQFNDIFDGQFDIYAAGFVESKDCVKEYFTKLMEQASTATTTAPLATAASASAQGRRGTANTSSCVVPTVGAAGDNMEVKAIVEDAKEVLQGHDGRCAPEGNGNLSFIVNGAGVRSQTVNCRTSVVVNLKGPSLSESKLKQLVEEEVREEVRKQMASTSI